jgi:hypothetical protein
MKRLAYVGLKQDGERAFQARTGIEWMPGSEHNVEDGVAAEMLKHTDVWREVEPKLDSAPAAKPAPQPESGLPAWVKKGVELGASDEQLEAIAQAGGPETEAGAALWKECTGTEFVKATVASAEKSKPAAKKTPAKKAAAKKAK